MAEDIRSYRVDDEDEQPEQREYDAAPDDEVPFEIPRD